MFYRIMTAPPGYGPDQRYLVAAYGSLDFTSYQGCLRTEGGSLFAKTIEEARSMIPEGAVQLPFEQHYQFIELWEASKD
jgi:hypothetical protein